MKKISIVSGFILVVSLLFFLNPIYAVDFDVQPRIETGVMSYYFEQGALSKTIQTGRDDASGYNLVNDEIEFSDVMSFVGGGATLFANRWFLDLSGQYAFNGEDRTGVRSSILNEQDEENFDLSTFTSVAGAYNTQLDRSDHAVSVGYSVTRRLSVYAGYKWAVIDLDATFEGPFALLNINNLVINGLLTGEMHNKFKYDGPFVGTTYGWPIEGSSLIQGLLSVNAGLARLNSQLNQRQNFERRIETLNGEEIDPIISPYSETTKTKGATLGLTLGLSWRGMTPVKNLSYSLAISGYRYQFDSDDAESPDISESAVKFKVGAAYVF